MSDTTLSTYELTGTRISPKRMEVDTGDATFVIGKDVNPVEYFLGSILGCLNSTTTMVARDMGIDIDELEVTVEGGVNYARYRGEESDDRPGLQGVEVTMSVDAAADEEELEALLAAVEERCPVTDNVENETGIDVSLDVQ
ncbi:MULTISPECIES: OsmC family protein [Haloferax]|uniref:OsmC family peroxiredoxin n=1 Tax=Haloferax marinum TaxID=2666143 RepID=A0A6A8GB41_9EURY|nr:MULTISPECIES: OsmC family protein [Haloferax]KAB1198692.1 OsmC family protein [Haloferax sp. CBA1150]MRW97808.1 OsmC family peroxiredoxin [Haloferax marinum]